MNEDECVTFTAKWQDTDYQEKITEVNGERLQNVRQFGKTWYCPAVGKLDNKRLATCTLLFSRKEGIRYTISQIVTSRLSSQ